MRKVFLTMMLLAATTLAWAQDYKQLTIIPKVGVNYSTTSLSSWVGKDAGEVEPDVKGVFGPMAGLEAEYRFSKRFAMSAAVVYSMEGRKFDNFHTRLNTGRDTRNLSIIDTQHHHYVNVPITANYYLVEGLALRAGLQLGMYVYKSGTENVFWPKEQYVEPQNRSLGSSPMKFAVSIPVGVSYALKNGLQFDLRYNYGLNSVSTDMGTTKEKGRTIQFTVGYRLNIL